MSVIEINKENYESEVLKGDRVLIDFWAPTCIPCRKMTALVEELEGEINDVKMVKINIDDQPQLAAALGIMSIPALVYFKNGKVVKKVIGVQSKKAVLKLLSK